jgi:DNA replication protein DnaC
MREKIKSLLDNLRLKGMANCVEDVLNDGENKGKAIADVLLELLEAQHRDQQERSLGARIKRAKLPWSWTIDTFPFKQQSGINKTQIMGLANLTFMQRNENLIFIGKPGTGKSGIAMGLLRLALLSGHRGRFYNAQDMLNELYSSLADRTTSKLLNTLCSYELLVIDELGYLTLNPEQINMFFKLIDMRYRKKSTIITTNLDFEAWYDVFKQKELVDAMLDRLKHHCTIIHIDGPSLRVPQSSIDTTTNKKTTPKLVTNSLDESSEMKPA